MNYIGLDAGMSGGLVCISGPTVTANKMPATEKDIWCWFSEIDKLTSFAIIEKVGGYIGIDQPSSSGFKFGYNYGLLRGMLIASGIPFDEVVPAKWQKAVGIAPRNKKVGETKVQHKNKLKAKAQQLFPDVKVTLATADALLIASYCKRYKEGTL